MNSRYDFRIIRVLRRRLNLTLQALAVRAGLTYPTVESIETNKTLPSLKTLDALSGALQISTSVLLGLAERRLVQRRKAKTEERGHLTKGDHGLEKCRSSDPCGDGCRRRFVFLRGVAVRPRR